MKEMVAKGFDREDGTDKGVGCWVRSCLPCDIGNEDRDKIKK